MATIKSYTDVKQSKLLSKILPLESADMCYINGDVGKINIGEWGNNVHDEDDIPCWSLAALFEVLHENKICHYNDRYYCQYITEGSEFPIYSTAEYDNPINACYEIILKLHELNLL